MDNFSGKVRQVTETIHKTAPSGRERKASMVSVRLYDRDGHLVEERYRKRKHINRITYHYNKKGHCDEINKYNADHMLFFRYRFKYDRWGHQIEEQHFSTKDGLDQTQSRRYNDKGQEVEHRMRKGESTEDCAYLYDDAGNVVEERHLLNGNTVSCFTYQYDEQNNLILDQQQYQDGTQVVKHYQYQYDTEGRIVDEQVLNTLNEMENHYSFRYDERGNRTQICEYKPDGDFVGRHITYDQDNRKQEVRWFNSAEGTCGCDTFTYNAQGLLLEESSLSGILTMQQQSVDMGGKELIHQSCYVCSQRHTTYQRFHTYDADGHETSQHELFYDNQGNITTDNRKRFGSNGLLVEEIHNQLRDVYQYDSHGNWTRKEHYEGDTLMVVNERHIEYYE